ncbi:MAG: T9SS C-terminal target domain-containing protein [Candidatus Zixiibacteriota bacterium]|nr:MAG: T9SS C-terminal target domain-containing protein [candidate division Zixibacteria bacterium]
MPIELPRNLGALLELTNLLYFSFKVKPKGKIISQDHTSQTPAPGQNYPNPFNPDTVIPLELPQRSKVTIELFNLRGQSLGLIYEGTENAGWPKIRYDASALASGVYFYQVTAEGLEQGGKYQNVGKMLLLK